MPNRQDQPSLFSEPAQPLRSDVVAAGIVPHKNPYAESVARAQRIVDVRDGEDLGAEQTGHKHADQITETAPVGEIGQAAIKGEVAGMPAHLKERTARFRQAYPNGIPNSAKNATLKYLASRERVRGEPAAINELKEEDDHADTSSDAQ